MQDVGCGTGFLTAALMPQSRQNPGDLYLAGDAFELLGLESLELCGHKFEGGDAQNLRFPLR